MGTPAKPAVVPEFFSLQVREARRFYLDLAPPDLRPTVVVCGGCECCEPDYSIHRENFPYYSIEFVARGEGVLTLGDHSVTLFPGVVFSYGPGTPHDIVTDRDDPLVKYFVDFTGSQATRMMRQHGLAPGATARVFAPVEIQGIYDDLIEDGLRGSRLGPPLCAALLEYLILKIDDCRLPVAAAETPAFATYQRCRQHIQTHYARLTTLGRIARECHVDPAYLCRLFARYDHQTPYQFLTRLKMNLAAQSLQNPGTLVKQVAAGLGFSDPFHFSRVFKRVLGLSPEAFRRLR